MNIKLLSITVAIISLYMTDATAIQSNRDSLINTNPALSLKSSHLHCKLKNSRQLNSMAINDINYIYISSQPNRNINHYILSLKHSSITYPDLSLNKNTHQNFIKNYQYIHLMCLSSVHNHTGNLEERLKKSEQITCRKLNFRPYSNESNQQNYQII